MFINRRRNRHYTFEIWPGFVDALSTVLMVIVFVLMTFVVSQLYLTETINVKDGDIQSLRKKIGHLESNLLNATNKSSQYEEKNIHLKRSLDDLRKSLTSLERNILEEQEEKEIIRTNNQKLETQLEKLQEKLKKLLQNLDTSESAHSQLKLDFENMKAKLHEELQTKTQELEKANNHLKKGSAIGQYRSEFFAKLKQAIGDRSDIRIVGDRFVFQSELFFDMASSDLSHEGKEQLNMLSKALKEIITKIPKDIKWVLRIDGHTDHIPIHHKFASNWELSAARAISVVKYLTKKGINAQKLVAGGFGEHQPLIHSKNRQEIARNRRIEFKLDQR